jgi:hypothetical protein
LIQQVKGAIRIAAVVSIIGITAALLLRGKRT